MNAGLVPLKCVVQVSQARAHGLCEHDWRRNAQRQIRRKSTPRHFSIHDGEGNVRVDGLSELESITEANPGAKVVAFAAAHSDVDVETGTTDNR
jgi:hypothetical protein